ncbi:MAG: carboxypeptidase regulatory-like domain-containing protein, partial [Longimicrobiales bacterium]|nr:carboxypeptidase regulatory-like domain-containing protein [Longimicrobiales bacterium]
MNSQRTRQRSIVAMLGRWGKLLMVAGALSSLSPGAMVAQDGGRIVGRVLDQETGRPLSSVQVYLADGSQGALSSLDGRYVIRNVPAGVYDVTAQNIGYGTKTVTGVELTAGRTTELDITLASQAVELEEIVITSAAQRGSTTALLNERKRSTVVSDGIGSEQISRSPDGDAAAALKRVPGLSVVDGKYAYVRGLGERYSSTTLNGAPLASPEPDKKVIPLDVIPSGLLESIVTSKSYSPDQPGDYAGGLVQLETRDFPANRILNVSVSGGWNSVATRANGIGYAGGSLDILGFDDGTRGLPSAIPRHVPLTRSNFTDAQLEEMGEAFGSAWGPTERKIPFNGGLGISYGDDFDFGDNQRTGFIASFN